MAAKKFGKSFLEYVDRTTKEKKKIKISDEDFGYYKQALQHFDISRTHIHTYFIHLWDKAWKDYLLYTGDRAAKLKSWQSNIAMGMIRNTIQGYNSYIEESRLSFSPSARSKEAFDVVDPEKKLTNMDMVRQSINYIADVTDFSNEIRMVMLDALLTGYFAIRTGYMKEKKGKVESIEIIDDIPVDKSFFTQCFNTPYSKALDPYTSFPDPSIGEMQYHTERYVTSIDDFIKTYAPMIARSDNRVKQFAGDDEKTEEENIKAIIDDLKDVLLTTDNADFTNYGSVRREVFRAVNEEMGLEDTLRASSIATQTKVLKSVARFEFDKENKVEVMLTKYEDRIVLNVNSIPVYIGDNFEGGLFYKTGTLFLTRERFSEGLPYTLHGPEMIQNSYMNNYIDGARHLAVPKYKARRGLIVNPDALEDAEPGVIIWADGNLSEVLQPIDNPILTDFGLVDRMEDIGQRRAGMSDINAGVASKVRTAAEAGALVGATNRQIGSFLKRFATIMGAVATDWLRLARIHWAEKTWGYSTDIDGTQIGFEVDNNMLKGQYAITLDSQGLLAVNKEMELTKKMEMFNIISPHLEPPQKKELIKDIYRTANLPTAQFMPDDANVVDPNAPIPTELTPEAKALLESVGGSATPPVPGQDVAGSTALPPIAAQDPNAAAMNPVANTGNGGAGRP